MKESSQSLIRTFINNDENIVLVYGDADDCDIQHLDLETIIINKEDVGGVVQALIRIMQANQKERL